MNREKLLKNLPDSPGVYLMKDRKDKVLYVGKAANLKRRVSSYFDRAHDTRIEKLVSEIYNIETRQTDTAIEALILEAKLIKELTPPYNIREKDDKSFLYVEIIREKFPRVLLIRGKDISNVRIQVRFGPFTSSSSIREALKILRKIFPWSTHSGVTSYKLQATRPCFDYQIGLCPGTCAGAITAKDYKKNIKNLKLFFEGKKERIIKSLHSEMARVAKKLDFERATHIRKQIFSLKHIQDVALISDNALNDSRYTLHASRIEGYDISNISGTSAVGSMVVFYGNEPRKSEYRKFKIRSAIGENPASSAGGDVGMMKEMLERRFKRENAQWELPSLVLVDGGAGQVRVAKSVLQKYELDIPVVGIAKGPERKRNDFIGFVPKGISKETLIRVRDEAHRFAISYHKKLRGKQFLAK